MKKKILAIALAAMTFSLTACGSANNSTQSPESSAQAESTEMTVTDSNGNQVTIPTTPERVVDLSGSSDILSILGYNIVGTCNADGYDYTKLPSYLEETLSGATVLGYSMSDTVDVEAIIALNPDLIVISDVQAAAYEQLAKVAPTIVINLEQVNFKTDFETVAAMFDKEDVAAEWIASYDETAAEVSALMKEKLGEDATYLSFLASYGSNYVFTNAAIGSILYDDLGLTRPAALPEQEDMTLPVVDSEGLAEINADYMFVVATDEDLATLEADAIYNNLTAVKEGHVITLTASPYFNIGYSPIGRLVFLEELKTYVEQLSE